MRERGEARSEEREQVPAEEAAGWPTKAPAILMPVGWFKGEPGRSEGAAERSPDFDSKCVFFGTDVTPTWSKDMHTRNLSS